MSNSRPSPKRDLSSSSESDEAVSYVGDAVSEAEERHQPMSPPAERNSNVEIHSYTFEVNIAELKKDAFLFAMTQHMPIHESMLILLASKIIVKMFDRTCSINEDVMTELLLKTNEAVKRVLQLLEKTPINDSEVLEQEEAQTEAIEKPSAPDEEASTKPAAEAPQPRLLTPRLGIFHQIQDAAQHRRLYEPLLDAADSSDDEVDEIRLSKNFF
jgi:hypothetical protein